MARTNRDKGSLDNWYRNVRLLVEYREANGGSCEVPQSFRPLGTWCNKQRQEYKGYCEGKVASRFSFRRIQVLESVGFRWAYPKLETNWMNHFQELESIHRVRGTVRIPLRLNKAAHPAGVTLGFRNGFHDEYGLSEKQMKKLGRWVTEQRKQKVLWDDGDASNLSTERIEMLDRLGFDWGQPRRRGRCQGSLACSIASARNTAVGQCSHKKTDGAVSREP
jgi:hypothetical protein